MPRETVTRERMLTGPITQVLLQLAWPTVTTAALQGIATALDGVMVARLGETAVASVTAARQVLMVVLVAGGAVAASTGILVSQAIGRGERQVARHITTQALISFCLLVLAVLTPVGWYATPWLLGLLTRGDAKVMALGVPYMQIVVLSLLPTLATFAAMGALRGAGDTKTPLKLTFWTNLLTAGMTYALIFGIKPLGIPALGVVGAAWGNLWSRGLVLVAAYWLLASGRLTLRLEAPRHWLPDCPLLGRMVTLGTPHALSSILLNVWGLVVIGILYQTHDGRAAAAAYGLSLLLRNFGTWVTWGFAEATMAMVGQNYGARRLRRAAQTGWAAARVASVYLIPVSLLIAASAPWLLGLIFNDDPARKAEILHIGSRFLWSQVVALPFLGAGMSLEGALRGTGDTRAPLLINVCSLYCIGIPSAYYLARVWGSDGVWVGMALGLVARGLAGWFMWRRTVVRWSQRGIEERGASR
ncbi:MAG: MATE family efflux transporter [Armatimonadetes bacterium]|nr:MATE family efflux transporter [Armatimonadota bacterium]